MNKKQKSDQEIKSLKQRIFTLQIKYNAPPDDPALKMLKKRLEELQKN